MSDERGRIATDPRLQQLVAKLPRTRTLVLHFACNNERGMFAGEVEGITVGIGGEDLELEGWAKFTVDDKMLRFCIHRVWFPFVSSREWVGNWCWNAYRLKRPQAVRLLQHLGHSGRWHATAGRTRVYDWFNAMVTGKRVET